MRSERLQKRPVALKLVGQVSETKQRYMFNIHNQSAHEMIEDYIAALRTIAGSGGGGGHASRASVLGSASSERDLSWV